MIDFTTWVSNFCESVEDVTDELTHTSGSVTTKIAPLMATFASGLSVLFAIYDGIGSLLDARIPGWAYWISFAIGVLVMLGLEGASLAAVFNNDRIRAFNATKPLDQQILEGSLPAWMLALTMLIVFCTEVAPTLSRWANRQVATSDLVFAFGLLALPLLGRAGAVIFSNSRTLDSLDGADAKRQSQKDKRRIADLEIDIKRKEAEQRLAQQQAEHNQKLELQRAKAESSVKKVAPPMQLSPNDAPPTPTQPEKVAYDEEKLRELVRFLMNQGDTSNDDLATHFGVHKTTIGRWVKALADAHVIEKKGHSKILNGRHQEFLAGASL